MGLPASMRKKVKSAAKLGSHEFMDRGKWCSYRYPLRDWAQTRSPYHVTKCNKSLNKQENANGYVKELPSEIR